jgi:hypothetical protein
VEYRRGISLSWNIVQWKENKELNNDNFLQEKAVEATRQKEEKRKKPKPEDGTGGHATTSALPS